MSTTTANILTVAVIIAMLISITVVMNTYTSAVYLPFSSVNSRYDGAKKLQRQYHDIGY